MDSTNIPPYAPGPETASPVAGYCRTCGRPLTAETKREVMGTLFCEDHVPNVNAPPHVEPPSPYAAGPGASSASGLTGSPALAFILGLIPGVGAIYNAQYAKGFVHVLIFGLLVHGASTREINGGFEALFGLMIAAFTFYMAFEAYHTAKARLTGQPVEEFSSVFPGGQKSGVPLAPILLIVLGVLFLLANFGWLPISEVLQFWPIGLILIGVYMLVNRVRGEVRNE